MNELTQITMARGTDAAQGRGSIDRIHDDDCASTARKTHLRKRWRLQSYSRVLDRRGLELPAQLRSQHRRHRTIKAPGLSYIVADKSRATCKPLAAAEGADLKDHAPHPRRDFSTSRSFACIENGRAPVRCASEFFELAEAAHAASAQVLLRSLRVGFSLRASR
ncbi:hypothetical protein QA640_14455 [Bradyrhizobium sp. CB82]|uniref:hypothetical protein n=1 Tax=Bradyrhizobium sp. CB82 TaxID=3039159 RepID=UPI0024B072B4|nr:hypothetical protein [Bradyrhizobium sp. CB82]WFU43540.1 hypothetical protein QA640_14455 [Bradyrhizobium sp. CB82]